MFKKGITLFLTLILLLASITPVLADSQKKGNARIVRDNYGVPHIYANNVEDLYFTYGYVMAQDRLFQLETFRRGNNGTIAEVFGEKFLARDQQMRRDGYTDQEVQEMITNMDNFSKKVIRNFADGISLYVEEALKNPDERLSKEFHDYKVTPKEWTEVDVLRLFMSSMGVFMDSEQEIKNAQILAQLEKQFGKETAKEMFDDIFWENDPASPSTLPDEGAVNPVKKDTKKAANQQFPGIEGASETLSEKRDDFVSTSEELGLPLKIGSNAVVIGPEKSATGNALLMGGPQYNFSAPGSVYEVGLHAPGFDIEGSGLIGMPIIMFGTKENYAFTSTYGVGNLVDIFVETLNPENPHQYLYKGKWVDMKKKVETFQYRDSNGELKEETKEFYSTVHGPVTVIDEKNNTAYSKAWSFRGTEAQSWSAYLKSNWAETMKEFHEEAKDMTMSINWYYADKEGNIGHFYTGKYPIRDERVDLRLPTPGTGEYEWKGFIDPKKHPYGINPNTGYIVNWNNRPASNWGNGELSFMWGEDHRVQQFIDLVNGKDKLTIDDIDDINYHASYVNLRTKKFKPMLMEALEKANNPKYQEVYQALEDWNNLNEDNDKDGLFDSPAVSIFEAWWPLVVDNLYQEKLGEAYGPLKGIIDHRYGSSLTLRVLGGSNGPLETQYQWLNEDPDQVMLAALDQALQKLEDEHQSEDISQWLKPARMMVFTNTSLIGLPQYGSEIKFLEANRGSENHYIELTKNGPIGENVNPPGQIGFISKDGTLHKHYDDQIELFANWKYKPVLFTKQDVNKNAVSTTVLKIKK
ncbi:penicillin acylase family protein [Niallia endozanthoxylica]|uniref:penicillin acylase family protein n=1 Tax=Niallia endozanthoxylica TaxID=2036016 RepID=UPI00168BE14D|nr:penicillin acylase family protein [Niallia endozanthoxylica]